MAKNFIPDTEFPWRIERVQALMAEQGLDALLAFSTESEPAYVRYLSDYWPSFETSAVLVPVRGKPFLLIGPESLTYARARSKISQILQLRDFRESSQPAYPGARISDWEAILAAVPLRTLGIAGWFMFPYTMVREILRQQPKTELVDADNVLRTAMARKSPSELACLREAAQISEYGLKAILGGLKVGMTEVQVAGLATAAMLEHGAEATGYPVWCCSGPNSNQAISRPTDRRIGTGEIVQVCIGAKVAGYSASIGRPLILGECSREISDFLDVGREAENLTFDLLKPGVEAATVASEVHEYIRNRGYGSTILYGPAHGCGQMECEYPFVETSSSFTLEEGMTFMVDIFLANEQLGFRWEDGGIIQHDGVEQLSSFAREVTIL